MSEEFPSVALFRDILSRLNNVELAVKLTNDSLLVLCNGIENQIEKLQAQINELKEIKKGKG